jgi:hypothetical protein
MRSLTVVAWLFITYNSMFSLITTGGAQQKLQEERQRTVLIIRNIHNRPVHVYGV